jgi:hypothetical protein
MAVKTPMSNNAKAGKLTAMGSPDAILRSSSEPHPFSTRRLAALTGLVVGLVLFGAMLAGPASALIPAPGWEVSTSTYPTSLSPGGSGIIEVGVYNVGAASSSGVVTVTDTLRPGLTATAAGDMEAGGTNEAGEPSIGEEKLWDCSGTTVVICTNDPVNLPSLHAAGLPRQGPGLPSQGPMHRIGIAVTVDPGASGAVPNQVTVAGGGALTPATMSGPIVVSSMPSSDFGFSGFDGWLTNADGTSDTQAGSHPYELSINLDFNTRSNSRVRDIETNLPPGLVGDPNAVPQCTRQQLDNEICPASTQIGVDRAGFRASKAAPTMLTVAVYNMVPPPGIPAQFAFELFHLNAFLDAGVRSGSDYGITEHVDNIPKNPAFNRITIWGVPADPVHDPERGCTGAGDLVKACSSGAAVKPLLTLPTSCMGLQTFTVNANTWQDASVTAEDSFVSHDSNGKSTGFTGCEHLGFGPSITTAPDTTNADTPAGLTVEVKPPLGGLSDVNGLSTSDIQNTTVTLPEGLVINPGQAAGLKACQESESGLGTEGPLSCPLASKVGTVKIKTPLLEGSAEKELEGNVYILQSNPPNLKLLVAASADGVNLKLVGKVHLDEATGRLTTKFEGTPELPVTDFKLSFNGGAQAALATPTQCGTYTTTSDFNPWSSPFVADVFPTSSFQISSGPGGGPCPSSPLPFSPSLIAGSTTDQAGGFTSFSLLLQRGDGQQRIEKLQFEEPAGLAGLISSVPLCDEANANAGTCSAASHIGHAVVTSGPGLYPLVLPQPGAPELPIYLTGPYKGAPFGLSIVTPVIAGPFNLGTIVTRAKIEVDPHTAQITITTDPLPQVVDGVPTDLRSINSIIDRPNFLFNPTNCNPQEFTGTATSAQGAVAPISSHFQVGSCRELPFNPSFAASTQGKTSKANGASLTVKVAQKPGEANIHKVNLQLPLALPSRLTTLQKACTEAQFNANPAGCPEASNIGTATAVTPVLNVPLTGPAFLVSHGGAAFPDVEFVLQGQGVQIVLDGKTDIKKGITFSRFETVPDAPISSFETRLPEGPHSVLAAYGNLCSQKLVMPTTIVGQNGAQVTQSTNIAVTGCGKPSIKITKAKIKGNTVLVTVTTTQQGTVTVSGNGLKTIKKTLAAGAHQLKVSLTKNGRTARKHHKKIKVKASVKDSNGSSSKTMTLKL